MITLWKKTGLWLTVAALVVSIWLPVVASAEGIWVSTAASPVKFSFTILNQTTVDLKIVQNVSPIGVTNSEFPVFFKVGQIIPANSSIVTDGTVYKYSGYGGGLKIEPQSSSLQPYSFSVDFLEQRGPLNTPDNYVGFWVHLPEAANAKFLNNKSNGNWIYGRWGTPYADGQQRNIMTQISDRITVSLYSRSNGRNGYSDITLVVAEISSADNYKGWQLDWKDQKTAGH